jgi:hypothetical protein
MWATVCRQLWREAFYLVQQGVVSVADVDTIVVDVLVLRWALLVPFSICICPVALMASPTCRNIWARQWRPYGAIWETLRLATSSVA